MVDVEGVVDGAGNAGAVSDGERSGSLVVVGARGSWLSSSSRLGSCGGTGAVEGRQMGACGTVVGRVASAVDDEESWPRDVSSVLERRLVTLNQLTGRTLVLACGRRVGMGVSLGAADLCASLICKADLSLLNSILAFLSPEKVMSDFLLSWSLTLLRFSSCA